MTRKRLILLLVAAGLVGAAACVVFSLYPGNWLDKDGLTGPATLPMAVPAPR